MALPDLYIEVTLVIASPQKSQFINVFWYLPETPGLAEDGQANADTAAPLMLNQLALALPGVLTTDDHDVGVRFKFCNLGLIFEAVAYGSAAGTNAGDQCPDFVAALVQKRTIVGGGKGRGRWFVGPVPEALTDENLLTTAGIAAYDALAATWWETFAGGGLGNLTPCLYSRSLNILQPLIGAQSSHVLATQRGRKFRSAV